MSVTLRSERQVRLVYRVLASSEASHFLALLSSQLIVAGVGLISTRFLPPEQKGLFLAAYQWSFFAFIAVSFSLPQGLFAAAPSGTRVMLHRRVSVAVNFVLLTAGVLVAGWMRAKQGDLVLGLCTVALPLLMFRFELSSYRNFAALGSFRSERLLQAVLFAILGGSAVVVTRHASPMLCALVGSYVVAIVFARFRIRNHPGEPIVLSVGDAMRWGRSAHPGLLFSTLAGKGDVLLVTAMFPATIAGHYAAAVAVPGLFAFVGTAIGISLLPRARALHLSCEKDALRFIGAIIFGSLMLMSLVAVIVFVSRSVIVHVLYGPAYADATATLGILAFAVPFWTTSALLANVLAVGGFATLQSAAQLAAIVLLAIGVVLSAPRNLTGVAVANVVAYVVASTWQSIGLARARRLVGSS